MPGRHISKLLLFLVLVVACTGCETVRKTDSDSAPAARETRLQQAEAGDPQAQYDIGRNHCCQNGASPTPQNLETSLRWLCRAGRQNFAPAQLLIGRIIAGDFGAVPRVNASPLTPESRRTVAAMWFSRAAKDGDDRAGIRAADLRKDMTPTEEEVFLALRADWRSAPCEADSL